MTTNCDSLNQIIGHDVELITNSLIAIRNWAAKNVNSLQNMNGRDLIDRKFQISKNQLEILNMTHHMQLLLETFKKDKEINNEEIVNECPELSLNNLSLDETIVETTNHQVANSCEPIRNHDQNLAVKEKCLQLVKKSFTQPNHLPAKGTTINVLVTSYNPPLSFYVQIIRNNSIMSEDLCQLINVINDEANIKTYQSYSNPPAIDDYVLVFHWSMKWLRGRVQEVTNEWVTVFILDFGDTWRTTIENIRIMKKEYMELPIQAIQCWFYNLENHNHPKIQEFIKKNVLMKPFIATVRWTFDNSLVLEVPEIEKKVKMYS